MTKKSIVMSILNDIEENIKKGNIEDIVADMYDLANEYEEISNIINENIITTEEIDELVKEKINNHGDWVEIKILLDDIKYNLNEYYYIDGYGNIKDLTIKHLELMYEDIKYELTDILEEEE